MVMMLGSVALLSGFYVWRFPGRSLTVPLKPPPPVRSGEKLLRLQLEAAQLSKLSSYGWEDDEKRYIRIPINRAMQILAALGAAAYDPIITPSASATSSGPNAAAAMQNPQSRVPSIKAPMRDDRESAAP
jgi:hypothetical protein